MSEVLSKRLGTRTAQRGDLRIDLRIPGRRRRGTRADGHLLRGAAAGALTAAVGALAWGGISYASGYQISFLSVGVGVIAGIAVHRFGHGTTWQFGAVGAVTTLLGCIAGQTAGAVILTASAHRLPIIDAVQALGPGGVGAAVAGVLDPSDIVFLAIALIEGWRLASITGPEPWDGRDDRDT